MSPHSSISGELPIDSYFSSAGLSGCKENRPLKRKNTLNVAGGDAECASTKKHKTKTPFKGSQARPATKADHTRSKEFRKSSASRTTSMPAPNSIMKQPRRLLVQVPIEDTISVILPSPMQIAPLRTSVTTYPSSKNTTGGFGLPTPPTVSHGSKTRSRADSASHPYPITNSRSVAQSGSSFRSPFPQTPSRSKPTIEINHTAHPLRTTPNSQRIVPSSQWFVDEQASSASLLEGTADGGDPFLHHHSRERCSEELALPSLFKLPPHPSSRAPTASSSSLPFASVSWNGHSPRHQSQYNEIEPTSQFDEVELGFSLDAQATPARSPQTKHDKNASSIKRLKLVPPQNPSPHSRDKVTQESSEDIYHTPPHISSSPLTPLTPSPPRVPDIECEKVSVIESDGPPSQHIPDKTHEVPSIPPSPEPTARTQQGKATPLSKSDVSVEDPTSDEDENFIVRPSPVRRRSLLQHSSPPASCTPSASTRRHLRISHAKLRSLPAVTVELNSDGEEMSSPGASISAFPSSPGVSCSASSYLDFDGTLPSEVGDFLDMVGTNTPSDT